MTSPTRLHPFNQPFWAAQPDPLCDVLKHGRYVRIAMDLPNEDAAKCDAVPPGCIAGWTGEDIDHQPRSTP